MVQGKHGKPKGQSHLMGRTYYGLWKRGLDIDYIQPPQPRSVEAKLSKRQRRENVQPSIILVPPTQEEQEQYQERMFEFFSHLGFGDLVPPVPTSNRPFVQLQESSAVWAMSMDERRRLAEHWEEEMRRFAYNNHLEEYERLRNMYEEACEKYEAVTDEVSI